MTLYVDRMIADRWDGVFCNEEETLIPTVEDVDKAIQALDAKTNTIVSLYGRDGAYLTIGGGEGRYIVYASTCNEQLLNLVDDTEKDQLGVILLNVGGQEGDFPSRQVIGKPKVLQAAQTFLLTGSQDSSLLWERQT